MKTQRGFTLVEIMVALVIGMIGVVIIMQVLESAERQKRTTATGTDAQVNGTIALYSLERDVRLAGYGLSSVKLLNCKVNAYNSARATALFSFQAAPVVINPAGIPAGDTGTDVLQIAYGDSSGVVEGTPLGSLAAFPSYFMRDAVPGLAINNFVVLSETGKKCALAQVTQDPPLNSKTIFTDENQWNPAGGPGEAYTDAGYMFNAGIGPRVMLYAVRKGRLTQCDLLNSPCEDANRKDDGAVWLEIGPGIVGLTAAYGRDTRYPDDGVTPALPARAVIPDKWDQTRPATADATLAALVPGTSQAAPATGACAWARIPAVSIALLARGAQYEAAEVTAEPPAFRVGSGQWSTACNGWTQVGDSCPFNMAGLTDWKHYRYKVFQTLVPLRNILWMDKIGC